MASHQPYQQPPSSMSQALTKKAAIGSLGIVFQQSVNKTTRLQNQIQLSIGPPRAIVDALFCYPNHITPPNPQAIATPPSPLETSPSLDTLCRRVQLKPFNLSSLLDSPQL